MKGFFVRATRDAGQVRGGHAGHAVAAVCLLVACGTTPVAAARSGPPGGPTLTPGAVTERVTCRSDPSQTYAAYLPSRYDAARPWPVLFVFDPMGRGTVALRIFADAAEQLGWIVVSSHDTLANGPVEPNLRALNAMWDDVPARLAVDRRRLYAAGFSGTVSLARSLAAATGEIAGIVAAGAAELPERAHRERGVPLFGAAGHRDFNYVETRRLVAGLAAASVPARFAPFTGGHEWMPPALARDALAWLELLAMKDGRRTTDAALVTRELERATAAVHDAERADEWVTAWRAADVAAATFSSLTDTSALAARASRLAARREVRSALADERRWDAWDDRSCAELGVALGELLSTDEVLTPREAADRLRVHALRGQARGTSYKADAAGRVLAWLEFQLSFLVWREQMAAAQYGRARLLLQVAALANPTQPAIPFRLAVTLATAGDRTGALRALDEAVALGLSAIQALDHEAFASIETTPEFEAIVERVRANAARTASP